MTGRFITIEGAEGAGKSTLARALADRLTADGRRVLLTREPGDGPIGPAIRATIMTDAPMDAWTEAFLFLADRRQHCEQVIRPALAEGRWVLCDRFADSTLVYQGYARDLDRDALQRLNRIAAFGLKPDLTLLLDLDPETGLNRLDIKDRLDREPVEFHRRVREGFLREASREPERWRIINAAEPPEALLEAAWTALEELRVAARS
ncbi:MAG: dTMP kinase [Armatimonadetes bacterium]|nr:dTMP kinase [Armatimonadota bacterium]